MTLKKILLTISVVLIVSATGIIGAGYWFFAYALPEVMQEVESEVDNQRRIDLYEEFQKEEQQRLKKEKSTHHARKHVKPLRPSRRRVVCEPRVK